MASLSSVYPIQVGSIYLIEVGSIYLITNGFKKNRSEAGFIISLNGLGWSWIVFDDIR